MSGARANGAGETIPVLFIAGAPRSGSTLIERVISMHEGLCPIGESHFVWERSFGENHLCGCGTPFHKCPFWAQVSNRAFGLPTPAFDYEQAIVRKRAVDRKRYLHWLLAPGRPGRYQRSLLAYGELLESLYRSVLDVTQARVILDSSKDPRHGLILCRSPGFSVHVVQLLRDPRAVAFSWRRHRIRPEIHWSDQAMPIEPISRTARRWSTHNLLVEMLCARADSCCRVLYEDFIADPSGALARILKPYVWLDGNTVSLDDPHLTLQAAHTVSGNPMRFERQVKLKLDDEWLTAMRARDRALVSALSWPLMLRYGYPVRSKSAQATAR